MHDGDRAELTHKFTLSDGEVDFLWWFIQGSIMDPDVRERLNAHWGLCARHALAFFVIEAAFRPHLIHGCSILYSDLMRRAANVLDHRGVHSLMPMNVCRYLLRATGPCHMCDLRYDESSAASAPAERLALGRDMSNARRFAVENRRGWLPFVCGRCVGDDGPVLCRPHLILALGQASAGAVRSQHVYVESIHSHLANFENAFRWDHRDTDTDEDRGALIAAIGWCSGWRELLPSLLDGLI
ncbi:hypothetical protein LGM57_34080 [Burkholderia cepacia]|uniref:hypothetical protein n=1 Tax=Burkholderia cepacia TaxID=292 RepID=UPI000B6B5652|nr:hypothetical protein [Burkholderia cepacia]MCA7981365.1 hypothetical protein [Burkholderia cepacia]OUE47451.1 hypothetical protein BZY94_05010 [Burkholderia territorii]HDR9497157.1 hypothetical protein [Burkholderia cepacia]